MPNVVGTLLKAVSVGKVSGRLLTFGLVSLSLLGVGAKSAKALDWQQVATGKNGTIVLWVDVDSIKVVSTSSKIVEYSNFSRETGADAYLLNKQANCVDGGLRTTYGKIFNSDGTLKLEGPGRTWEWPQPDKLGYAELSFACRKAGL